MTPEAWTAIGVIGSALLGALALIAVELMKLL